MKFWPAVLAIALLLQGCASPLHQAALKGEKYKVIELLDKGAKIDSRDSRGRTPLYLAASVGNADTVQELLDRNADPYKGALLQHGNTPLHVAAQNGFNKVIEIILAKTGTNTEVRNLSKQTPLMLAAWGRHPQTVTLLINRGANVHAIDRYGWSALHTPWNAPPADADYSAVMEILIANQAFVNLQARVPPGYTPLMGAAAVGDKNTVELLIEKGARINDVNGNGQTAFAIAEDKRWPEAASALSDHGGMRYNPVDPAQILQAPPEPSTETETQ